MQTVSSLMFIFTAIEILVLPVLLAVWLIRKARKKPKMKWLKWFWLSFALFVAVGAATNPATWCKHEYRVVESKEASCTENGYEKSHCDLCGSDKTKAIKKLGHSMVDVRRVEPTDDKDGEYVQRCTRCGYESIKVLSAPKKAGNSGGAIGRIKAAADEPDVTEEEEMKYTVAEQTGAAYSKKAKSFAKKYKVPVELMGSLEEAIAQTDFPYSFADMNGLEYADDWAGGARYRVWHYAVKEDKYYRILVYEKHDRVSALYDITDGRELIYSAADFTENDGQEADGILLAEGTAGEYGKKVTIGGESYFWYMVPSGAYLAECQLKYGTLYVVSDDNSEDVRQTVQFTEAGGATEVTVEEGTHIELSIQAEVLLIPVEA
nr:MAG TPA: TcaB9 [Caudoviricetes sp.]